MALDNVPLYKGFPVTWIRHPSVSLSFFRNPICTFPLTPFLSTLPYGYVCLIKNT